MPGTVPKSVAKPYVKEQSALGPATTDKGAERRKNSKKPKQSSWKARTATVLDVSRRKPSKQHKAGALEMIS